MMWRWRWLLGLATAAAVIALVAIPLLRQAPAPVIQVAMLDTAGASRGAEAKELALLQQTWNKAVVDSFSSTENARAWETNWPGDGRGAVVKVLYDRPAGELRVLGRWKGKSFARTFVVEQDFAAALTRPRRSFRSRRAAEAILSQPKALQNHCGGGIQFVSAATAGQWRLTLTCNSI